MNASLENCHSTRLYSSQYVKKPPTLQDQSTPNAVESKNSVSVMKFEILGCLLAWLLCFWPLPSLPMRLLCQNAKNTENTLYCSVRRVICKISLTWAQYAWFQTVLSWCGSVSSLDLVPSSDWVLWKESFVALIGLCFTDHNLWLCPRRQAWAYPSIQGRSGNVTIPGLTWYDGNAVSFIHQESEYIILFWMPSGPILCDNCSQSKKEGSSHKLSWPDFQTGMLNETWVTVNLSAVIWAESISRHQPTERDVMWCDVMWCDVMWCDVMWCDVMWCDVMWCDVMWCDVMWCDVMWILQFYGQFHVSCQVENCYSDQYLSVLLSWRRRSWHWQGNEEYFVVKWSSDAETGAPLLLAAGHLGQIRVLNCHHQNLLWVSLLSLIPVFSVCRSTTSWQSWEKRLKRGSFPLRTAESHQDSLYRAQHIWAWKSCSQRKYICTL